MKIAITCAGSQTKWNNYMGIPKQMVPMFGVPMLQRTVQAMNRVFPDSRVYVSIQDQSKKELYIVDGKYEFYVLPQFDKADAAIKSLVPLFKEIDDDFLVLMGDVSFSKGCIDKIYKVISREQSKESNEIKIFGRRFISGYLPHKWGELFAYHIPRQVKSRLFEAIEIVDKYYNLKLINRKIGWEIISCYFAKGKSLPEIQKMLQRKNYPSSSFITVEDETDDFDFPDEYDYYVNKVVKKNYRWVILKFLRNIAPARFVYFRLINAKASIKEMILVAAAKVLPKPVKKLIKKLLGWE